MLFPEGPLGKQSLERWEGLMSSCLLRPPPRDIHWGVVSRQGVLMRAERTVVSWELISDHLRYANTITELGKVTSVVG